MGESENKKEILLKLPEDLYEQIRILSLNTNLTMNQVIRQFLYDKIMEYDEYINTLESYQNIEKNHF